MHTFHLINKGIFLMEKRGGRTYSTLIPRLLLELQAAALEDFCGHSCVLIGFDICVAKFGGKYLLRVYIAILLQALKISKFYWILAFSYFSSYSIL